MIRFARVGLPVFLALGLVACHDSKTTTAPGSLANVTLSAPDSAKSGQGFTIDVSAVAVGVNNVHNSSVNVTLPAPLTVAAADASSGTSATFSNGSGATVSWTLGSLDSNSQARLHIQTMGVLPVGAGSMSLTVTATLTADGIHPGDAVAHATIQLTP
ncbi:MAG TPA: hypothetical protein VKE50_01800 [Thermoanaerobaculia bacterium]|nr:hypothetical protein [Thermoanaerobaculia bacterium]